MRRRDLLSTGAAMLCGACASRPQAPDPDSSAATELIPADPRGGFNFPYLLRRQPRPAAQTRSFLLVEPNNSGHVSLDFKQHLEAAAALIENGLGGQVARLTRLPILMPVFPRGPDLYTHSLGRSTLLTSEPRLQRLDHQLLAMIDHARKRLARQGWLTEPKVLLSGFSASGMFATRFTALHPHAVQALAAGGLNGFVILPVPTLEGTPLPFHLGVGDVARYTSQAFQATTWKRIPQLLFMGATDTNDAVLFDDAYSPAEREIIFRQLGREMLPLRWQRCRQVYHDAGAAAAFVTYAGIGHGTNGRIHADVAQFFRSASAAQG